MIKQQNNFPSLVAPHFAAASDTYDLHAEIQKQAARKLTNLLNNARKMLSQALIGSSENILEIGCGTGLLTASLTRLFPDSHIVAVDIAGSMLEQARKRLSASANLQFVETDARELEFADEFSLTVSSSALHWMLPLEDTFRRIQHFLTKGGVLMFAMMVRGTLPELHQLRSEVAPHKASGQALPEAEKVAAALRKAGFTLVYEELESAKICYDSAAAFLQALRQQGVNGGFSASGNQLTRGEIRQMLKEYQLRYGMADGGVSATYNVYYGKAVK